LKYLDDNNLDYKIDKSNYDLDITRNYLRHEIIPKFEKINKNYKENISNTLDYFADLKDFVDLTVKQFLDNFDYIDNHRFFIIEDFMELNLFLKKEVIRYIYYISN
jgi:tRNA(Ile)-lysidine synthase